ncbi:MAG TPA: 2,4'-dihydroxyacetophenone dioxygenase family protein [Burkholderiaceae bacterium]|nr:2,4'-dihydroxyacetophenone dioxygenase family protein [Burkholderiaceae bacterium]
MSDKPLYIDTEKRIDKVRDQYAIIEGYIDTSEKTSPWIPFIPNIWLRHLSFDIRKNVSVHIMRADKGGSLGRHRHRAQVTGYVLSGSLRYEEYDWVARAGDFFHESPGRTHTLVSDEGMETLFHLGTPIEFLDENDHIIEIVDVFWMIDHYVSYCEKNNLPVNEMLFV